MRNFLQRPFTAPLLVMLPVAGNAIGLLVVLPLVLTNVIGLSILELGLFLVQGGVAIPTCAAASGRTYDRFCPALMLVPAPIVWVAVPWFLSGVD